MSLKSIPLVVLLPALLATGHALAVKDLSDHLDSYRQRGVEHIDAERGRKLWYDANGERSCTSCHGEAPVDAGKHVKTGKPIAPMAPSVNAERYRSAKKIEKWFLRNCKWTYGRECSTQEKADILTWLTSQ